MSEISWHDAIVNILKEAGEALHYQEITERILSKKLKNVAGATPHFTVNATITASIKRENDKSPFVRVSRGTFALRDQVTGTLPLKGQDEEAQYGVITSFGMFWRREAIEWGPTPKIFGVKMEGAKAVDFNGQVGIYLLYDGREVIYVGRATERPLGLRLKEHTVGRLSTRWDRFSWFGLLPVSEEGTLERMPESCLATKIIPALEAILIEALEPRQNRKRGDDLSEFEFSQKEDPEVQKRKMKRYMAENL